MVIEPSSQAIETGLEIVRQKHRTQAGSLITTIFGDAILPRGGRVSLGSMIHLLQSFGVNERLVRTAVYRLIRQDWLQSEAVGRKTDYMLTHSGRHRFDEAATRIYATDIPSWDRCWRIIMVIGQIGIRRRDQLRKALFWHGFGETSNGNFIHPTSDLEKIMETLVPEGLQDVLAQLVPMIATNSEATHCASDSDMVKKAWNLKSLAESYEAFLRKYEPIFNALEKSQGAADLSAENAFHIRTLMIHDVRRLLLRDPELPEILLPVTWPSNRTRHLCRSLYRKLLPLSEHYLDSNVRLSNGVLPQASHDLTRRFECAVDMRAENA